MIIGKNHDKNHTMIRTRFVKIRKKFYLKYNTYYINMYYRFNFLFTYLGTKKYTQNKWLKKMRFIFILYIALMLFLHFPLYYCRRSRIKIKRFDVLTSRHHFSDKPNFKYVFVLYLCNICI